MMTKNNPQILNFQTVNSLRIVVDISFNIICANQYEDELHMVPTKKLALHGAGLVFLGRRICQS
jgi:hypothetical protein|tara:strand:+ start:2850 stop:3041 length:192 start_codon:yes stop_codon:yes gene_type:complete